MPRILRTLAQPLRPVKTKSTLTRPLLPRISFPYAIAVYRPAPWPRPIPHVQLWRPRTFRRRVRPIRVQSPPLSYTLRLTIVHSRLGRIPRVPVVLRHVQPIRCVLQQSTTRWARRPLTKSRLLPKRGYVTRNAPIRPPRVVLQAQARMMLRARIHTRVRFQAHTRPLVLRSMLRADIQAPAVGRRADLVRGEPQALAAGRRAEPARGEVQAPAVGRRTDQ
jgi:hypothetical protein